VGGSTLHFDGCDTSHTGWYTLLVVLHPSLPPWSLSVFTLVCKHFFCLLPILYIRTVFFSSLCFAFHSVLTSLQPMLTPPPPPPPPPPSPPLPLAVTRTFSARENARCADGQRYVRG
jgi:hypothetical protein